MFTRNKRRYRNYIFAAAVLTLCLLVIAVAWPQPQAETVSGGENPESSQREATQQKLPGLSPGEETDEDTNSDSDIDTDADTDADADDDVQAGSDAPAENDADMNPDEASYYLVKRAGQQIVVYFCDASGQQVQLEETQILYEMLGPEDQKLFDQGIRLNSQEELSMLLQDFES